MDFHLMRFMIKLKTSRIVISGFDNGGTPFVGRCKQRTTYNGFTLCFVHITRSGREKLILIFKKRVSVPEFQ